MEPITAAQMRKIEQDAIRAGQVSGATLMERAGQGVLEAMFAHWPRFAPRASAPGSTPVPGGPTRSAAWRAAVLCGPGNNGGDGFVVARLLAGLGWAVDVYFYGDTNRLPSDARLNYVQWCAIGDVLPLRADVAFDDGVDVVVDAVFGIGLNRALASEVWHDGSPIPAPDLGCAFGRLCACVAREEDGPRVVAREEDGPRVVAIDIVSGLCADRGVVLQPEGAGSAGGTRAWAGAADLTVTFHRPKPGHLRAAGAALSGHVVIRDIGL